VVKNSFLVQICFNIIPETSNTMNKQEILEAYKVAVKENDGKVLGIDKFTEICGINEHELTKHWIKMSNLQAAAGVATPVFGESLDMTVVINTWCSIISYFKHYPTQRELDNYLNNNSSIGLSLSTLTKKLGNTKNTINQIIAYCMANNIHLDVVASCEAKLQTLPDNQNDDVGGRDNLKHGWVYLIHLRSKQYKIGKTDNLNRRLDEHSHILPDIKYAHNIETDDPSGVEAYWKQRWKDKLVDKSMSEEVFNLTSDDVAAFKRWRRIV
jgi:hypothetical protein